MAVIAKLAVLTMTVAKRAFINVTKVFTLLRKESEFSIFHTDRAHKNNMALIPITKVLTEKIIYYQQNL